MSYPVKTKHGYLLSDVVSALQKCIRRGDARRAMYFAIEMWKSGFHDYVWRRLLTIAGEDVYVPCEAALVAMKAASDEIRRMRRDDDAQALYVAKAAKLLALAPKCRDTDNCFILYWEADVGDDKEIKKALKAGADERPDIPPEAFDCHTAEGRRRGKTRSQFIVDEHLGLKPRVRGLFDDLVVEEARKGKYRVREAERSSEEE